MANDVKTEPKKKITEEERLQLAVEMGTPVTGNFIVGPEKAYRKGRLYQPGEIISLVNEKPSRTFKPYVKGEAAGPEAVVVPGAVNLNLGG